MARMIGLKTKIDFSYSKENIGICYALNAASSLVKTPYIVYFNDDMYACPDWDKYLYNEVKIQKIIISFYHPLLSSQLTLKTHALLAHIILEKV